MKAKIDISLDFRDEQTVNTIYRSLEPDNIDLPKDIVLGMSILDRCLNLKIVAENNVSTLISTLDDLLESTQISLSTLKISDDR